MINNLGLGLVCVVLISVGQILFKIASLKISFVSFDAFLKGVVLNYHLLSALILYFFTTILWVKFLKSVELKDAYPIMALAFLFVPVLSNFFLDEKVNLNNFIGGFFIVIGIVISVR